MRYRDIEYAVVQDVERGGWKWSASVAGVVITGEQASKSAASVAAERAIDRAVSRQSRLALRHAPRFNGGMSDTRIDFSAPQSFENGRHSTSSALAPRSARVPT